MGQNILFVIAVNPLFRCNRDRYNQVWLHIFVIKKKLPTSQIAFMKDVNVFFSHRAGNLKVSWHASKTDLLAQCFSTYVPRHTSVPWAPSKCAAKLFFLTLPFLFFSKKSSFCQNCDFLGISVPHAAKCFLNFSVPRAKKGWEPLF